MKKILFAATAAVLLCSSAWAFTLRTTQNALSTSAEIVLPGFSRSYAEIKNLDAAITIYLGNSSAVTSSTGHAVKAGEAFGIDVYDGEVWAIAASGTPTISIVEW